MHESFNPLAPAQSASGAVAIRVIESPLLHDGTAS